MCGVRSLVRFVYQFAVVAAHMEIMYVYIFNYLFYCHSSGWLELISRMEHIL